MSRVQLLRRRRIYTRPVPVVEDALHKAATALYEAGCWSCDRPVDETGLWEALRDALGRKPGNAPKPKLMEKS